MIFIDCMSVFTRLTIINYKSELNEIKYSFSFSLNVNESSFKDRIVFFFSAITIRLLINSSKDLNEDEERVRATFLLSISRSTREISLMIFERRLLIFSAKFILFLRIPSIF